MESPWQSGGYDSALPLQGPLVPSLVGELRHLMPCSKARFFLKRSRDVRRLLGQSREKARDRRADERARECGCWRGSLPAIPPPPKMEDFQVAQWWRIRLPVKDTRVWSLDREDPLEREMATHSRFLPGKSHGQRNLVGYSPWGHKESDTTECAHACS